VQSLPIYLAYSLLTGIFAASLAVWLTVITKMVKRKSPLQLHQREKFEWHLILVLLIALLASYHAVKTQLNVKPAPANFESVEASLDRIRHAVLSKLVLVALIPGFLVVIFDRKFADFGFRRDNLKHQVLTGAIGFLAASLPVAAIQLLLFETGVRDGQHVHTLLVMLREHPQFSVIAWVAVSAIVSAPAAEELLYRVILQGALQSQVRPGLAIVFSSIVFSCVHAWPDPLPLFPLALILGYVFYKTNSYLAVVTLHALFNATNLILTISNVVEPNS